MSLNNFNEKLNDLHETLRILHKKSLQENGLGSIDREVIKFKIVQFYEDFFVKANNEVMPPVTTPIPPRPERPVEEILSASTASRIVEMEELPTTAPIPTKDWVATTIEKETIPTLEETEKRRPAPVFQSSMMESMETPITSAVVHEPLVEHIETPRLNTISTKGLNDRFSHVAVNQSLNERFKDHTTSPITEKFASHTKSITDLIDLNKRMLFVTQLFNSNHELYQQVLKHIDSFSTANEAILFMEHNKSKLQLDAKKEEIYTHFLEIIQKKF